MSNDPTGHMLDEGCKREGCNLNNERQSQQVIIDSLLNNPRTWDEIPDDYKKLLQSAGVNQDTYRHSDMSGESELRNANLYEDPIALSFGIIIGGKIIIIGGPILLSTISNYFMIGDPTNADDVFTLVLGHWDLNVKMADRIGGYVMNVPSELYNSWSDVERWAFNQEFLENALANGDRIVASNPLFRIPSAFQQEILYFLNLGYEFVNAAVLIMKKGAGRPMQKGKRMLMW